PNRHFIQWPFGCIQPLASGNPQKLPCNLFRLPGRLGMDPPLATKPMVVIMLSGHPPGSQQMKEIRLRIPKESLPLLLPAFVVYWQQDVSSLGQSRNQTDTGSATQLISRKKHPGITRMHRELRHSPPGWSQCASVIQRSQVLQQG